MSTIEEIYEAQLAAKKNQLDHDYSVADEGLTHQKEINKKTTDTNLTRTAVEAQKAAVSQAELHNASGLSSGAQAQARLAQENQLQSNLTALRTAQQESDAEVERQRGLLAQEYAAAIRQAQSENDLAKAEALYKEAQQKDQQLLEDKKYAAQLMAQTGDYSRMAELYKLSDKEVAALQYSYALSLSSNSDTNGGGAGGMTYDQAKYLSEQFGQSSYLLDYLGIPFDQWESSFGYRSPALDLKTQIDDILAGLKYRNNLSDANATTIIRAYLNNTDLTDTEYRWLASQYGLI